MLQFDRFDAVEFKPLVKLATMPGKAIAAAQTGSISKAVIDNSIGIITALNPYTGYEIATPIAKARFRETTALGI